MKLKPLYMAAVGVMFAGLFAVAPVAPAGAARGSLTADPHHVNCRTQGVSSGIKFCTLVTFTNNTSTPVQITLADIDSDTGAFFSANDNCTGNLRNPGAACTVEVDFDPTVTGHERGELAVFETTFDTVTTVGLGGRGV
jgi:hypothetical protein